MPVTFITVVALRPTYETPALGLRVHVHWACEKYR